MQNKAKKISFSFLLCLIIGILTALSFVLSFSGAWFTSSKSTDSQNISLKFGSVQLGANFSGEAKTYMVPSETISYYGATASDNISYIGTVSAYYRISYVVTNSENNVDSDVTEFDSNLAFNNVQSTQFNDTVNKCVYGYVDALGSIPQGSLVFSKNAGNELADKEFKIKFKIDLMQGVNLSGISGTGSMSTLANYQALFSYYDSNISA